MTLIIILLVIFAVVALMVILGERYAKPMEPEQQAKLSKIAMFACFLLIIGVIIRELIM